MNPSRTIAALMAGLLGAQPLLAYETENKFWQFRQKARADRPAGRKVFPSTPVPWPVASRISSFHGGEEIPDSEPTPDALGAAFSFEGGQWSRGASGSSENGGPTVVLVQDVHQNTEVQWAIGKAVERLARRPRTVVGLEGASGPVDLSVFRQKKYQDVSGRVADWLLRQNLISGPIHGAIRSPLELKIYGVESAPLYRANVAAYQAAAPLQKNLKGQWASWQRRLAWRKKQIYNPALASLDRTVEGYRRGKIPWEKYIDVLLEGDEAPLLPLKELQQVLAFEKNLDGPALEVERRRYLNELGRRLTPQDLRELASAGRAVRAGTSSDRAFYERLKRLGAKVGLPWDSSPALRQYEENLSRWEGLNLEEVRRALSAQENIAYGRRLRSPLEKEWVEESRRAHLTGRLLDFALGPEEWAQYKSLRLSPSEIRPFEKFYEYAEARNNALADGFWKIMERTQSTTGVLVVGGYHTEALVRRLENRGVRVWVWTPRMKNTEAGASSLTVFLSKNFPLERFWAENRAFLAPPPVAREAPEYFVANAAGALAGEKSLAYEDSWGAARVSAIPDGKKAASVAMSRTNGVFQRWKVFVEKNLIRLGPPETSRSWKNVLAWSGGMVLSLLALGGDWALNVLMSLLSIPIVMVAHTSKIEPPSIGKKDLPFHLSTLVADVDMTLIESGTGILEGKNKDLILRALRAGIQVILISGSVYHPGNGKDYATLNSLKRRIKNELLKTLQESGEVPLLKNLEIHYISGKGSVGFSEKGGEIEKRDLIYEMSSVQRGRLLKGFAGAYVCFHKGISIEDYWKSPERTQIEGTDSLEELVSLLRGITGKLNFEMYDFSSSVGLYEKEDLSEKFHQPLGKALIQLLLEIQKKQTGEREGKPLFYSFGEYYAQGATLRKRDVIARRLEKRRVKDGGVVVGIGDSTIDDFLHVNEYRFPYWSFYLGEGKDLPEDSLARLVRNTRGEENTGTAGFEAVIGYLVNAHEKKKPFSKVMSHVNNKWPKHDALLRRMAREEGIEVGPDTRYGIYVGGPHIRDGYYYRVFSRVAATFFKTKAKFAYLPVDVEPGDRESQFRLAYIRRLLREHPRVLWAVVTRPWKEFRFHHRNKARTKTGAVNFVVSGEEGMVGHATDGRAWLKGLSRDLGRDYDFGGKNLVVLGAGGAAKEIAEILIGRKVRSITFVDPNVEQREKMGQLLESLSPDYRFAIVEGDTPSNEPLRQALKQAQVVVNATGVGRGDTADRSPLREETSLVGVDVVSEFISIGETPFMKRARADGVRQVFNGRSMAIYGMVEYFGEAVRQLDPAQKSADYETVAFARFEKALSLEDLRQEILQAARIRGIAGGPWTKYLLRPIRSPEADDGVDVFINKILEGLGKDVRAVNLPITGPVWKMVGEDEQFQIMGWDDLGLNLERRGDRDALVEELVPYVQKSGEGPVDREAVRREVEKVQARRSGFPPTAAFFQSLSLYIEKQWPTSPLAQSLGRRAKTLGVLGLALEAPFLALAALSLPGPLLVAFLLAFGGAHFALEGRGPFWARAVLGRTILLGLYGIIPLGMDPLWAMALHGLGDLGLLAGDAWASRREGRRNFETFAQNRLRGGPWAWATPLEKRPGGEGDPLINMIARWGDASYRAGALSAARERVRSLDAGKNSGAAGALLGLLGGGFESPLSLVDVLSEDTSVEDVEKWIRSYEIFLRQENPPLRWALVVSPGLRPVLEGKNIPATVFYTQGALSGQLTGETLGEMAGFVDPWSQNQPVLLRLGKSLAVEERGVALLPSESGFRKALAQWVKYSEEIEKVLLWIQAVAAYA